MEALFNMRRGWLDFLLCGIGGAMVTYATGMSIGSSKLAFLFSGMVVVGTFLSFLITQKFQRHKWFGHTIWIYVLVGLACPFLAGPVNERLPDEGFPRELLFNAAPLIWMVALCSFVAWTDGALSFQSVPCIALFGLVGAFNTFGGATVTFFIFLVCAASLYARSHQRHMIERAHESGYRHLATLRQGPWRWVAGPEWALGSAAAIVVLSLIGAPVIQESVKNVAGAVRIEAPRIRPSSAVASFLRGVGDRTNVGTGPRGEISDETVFRIKIDEIRYLRTHAYTNYIDGGWNRVVPTPAMTTGRQTRFPSPTMEDIEANFDEKTMELDLSAYLLDKLPIATPFYYAEPSGFFGSEGDGTFRISNMEARQRQVVGHYFARKPTSIPKNSTSETDAVIDHYLNIRGMSPKVTEWAASLWDPEKSDFENAELIEREIGNRTRYNLKAAAAPSGADPVEYFLFGPVRQGYCDLFASAMVQSARSIGIPARYITGFLPSPDEVEDHGWYRVRSADFHAWAELYFEGYGWVAFDPTKYAESIPGGERGSARDRVPWQRQKWVGIVLNVALGLIAAALVFFAVKFVRGLTPDTDPVAATLDRAYEKFVRSIGSTTGIEPSQSMTPMAYFELVRFRLGMSEPVAADLFLRFSNAFYGLDSVRLADAENLLADSRAFTVGFKKTRSDAS